MDVIGDPGEHEQPLAELVAPLAGLEEAATQASEALTRQRCAALGAAVRDLALYHNGLAEPGMSMEEMRTTIVGLVGNLGLVGVVLVDQGGNLGLYQQWAITAQYSAAVSEAISSRGLSLREVGRMSGVSHTHVGAVRNGTASWLTTRKVAVSLGLIEAETLVDPAPDEPTATT